MIINEAGQGFNGGVPISKLTPSDVMTYYGAIIGSNSDGDLFTWDGESNVIEIFAPSFPDRSTYDYSGNIMDDFAGRGLAGMMNYITDNY